MATHLTLDPLLLQEALKLGGFKSENEAVNQALREFVQRRKQCEVIDLFGNLPADPDYDYKQSRFCA